MTKENSMNINTTSTLLTPEGWSDLNIATHTCPSCGNTDLFYTQNLFSPTIYCKHCSTPTKYHS